MHELLVSAPDVRTARLIVELNDDVGVESALGVRLLPAAEGPVRVVDDDRVVPTREAQAAQT